jgi:hypothetical protein
MLVQFASLLLSFVFALTNTLNASISVDASFKFFCGFCICKFFKFLEASLQAIAGMLLEFNKVLPTHAGLYIPVYY